MRISDWSSDVCSSDLKSRQNSWSGDSCSTVEFNTADSAAFIPLRGIGPVLSARIVKYRERLGGFHVVEQLLEVYGMDTIAFRNFRSCLRVDRSLVEMIDLNRAGYRELRRLPYWSSSQINVV